MIKINELMKKVKELDYDITFLNDEETELFERYLCLKQTIGKLVKHFKGKHYLILNLAEETETGETLVVYKAMYGDYKIYARPLDMFLSKVDKEKYPKEKQEYRFEFIKDL